MKNRRMLWRVIAAVLGLLLTVGCSFGSKVVQNTGGKSGKWVGKGTVSVHDGSQMYHVDNDGGASCGVVHGDVAQVLPDRWWANGGASGNRDQAHAGRVRITLKQLHVSASKLGKPCTSKTKAVWVDSFSQD